MYQQINWCFYSTPYFCHGPTKATFLDVFMVNNPGFAVAKTFLGGGSKYFCFHPYLGKIPILTNISQRGWFNHQLALFFMTFWGGLGGHIN